MNYRNATLSKPLVAALFLLLCATCAAHAASKDAPRSFSLSTSRTFAPGESVKIQLFAKNVPELEFRVYKVRDAEKFFAALKDVHSFGAQSYSPTEQIDQRTLLERLHDFKAHLCGWSAASFAASLPTMRATASAKARPSWANAAASWAYRNSRAFPC